MKRLHPVIRTLASLALVAGIDLIGGREVAAQEPVVPSRVRVFVDCNGDACDSDHLQREIVYVDWVRDRVDADVEVLVTEEDTGAGGQRYDLAYAGRRGFDGVDEALRYTQNPTDTDAEARDALTATFAAGLLRYVARTSTLQRIMITYEGVPEEDGPQSPDGDPWNRLVFRTGLGASVAAEDRSDDFSLRADQSLSRVTEKLKLGLELSARYEESHFDTSDTTSVTSRTESYRADLIGVLSIGSHWGAGLRASAERSTFRNYDLAVRVAPAVEYNLFPYEQSTRRQLRMLYAVGPQWFNYEEETIYSRTVESRFHESLSVSLDMQEYWGSAVVALEGSHYLDDFAQNRLEGYGFVQVRLFRGFGVFVEGNLARVRDQIALPRGDATEEEVLLRQRELKTDFRLGGRVGFDVTFGSVFSDVVNARFGS